MNDNIKALCKDLATFQNPDDIGKAITESLIGYAESYRKMGVLFTKEQIKQNLKWYWRMIPYRIIPKRIIARSILSLSCKVELENNKDK